MLPLSHLAVRQLTEICSGQCKERGMGGKGAGGVFNKAGGLLVLLHWVCGAEGGSKVVAGGELVEEVELVAGVKHALCPLIQLLYFSCQ